MMIVDLLKGKWGLSRTFWIFGVLIWMLFYILKDFLWGFFSEFHSRIDPSIAFEVGYALFCIYTGIIAGALWHSARLYSGKRTWVVLAKIYSILMFIVLTEPLIMQLLPLSINPNTASVISKLHPTSQMPYVGFWKVNGPGQFGIAIAPAESGLYSVSFCGPGGCFEPGTWNPNTKLIDDPCYRIIDEDTIEMKGRDDTTEYKRVTESPPKQKDNGNDKTLPSKIEAGTISISCKVKVPKEFQQDPPGWVSPNGEPEAVRYKRSYEAFFWNCVMVLTENPDGRCPFSCSGTPGAADGCLDGAKEAEYQVRRLFETYGRTKTQESLRSIANTDDIREKIKSYFPNGARPETNE